MRCTDCNLALVPERPKARPERLVKIAEVANDALAGMWAELLHNEGVPCLVQASGLSASVWSHAATMSHYLVVRARDKQRARALLQEIAGQDPSISISPDA